MRNALQTIIYVARCACVALMLTFPAAASAQEAEADPLQTDVLDGYEILIGDWRPDPASLSDGVRQWRAENNISENWVSFEWGSERQWMRFGDWQRKDGANRHTGAGLVAYDPAGRRVMFTEHGIRGASVIGTLERVSPTEIARDIVVTRTDTAWRQIDRWVWEAGEDDCFAWSMTIVNAGARSERPASRWCRMDAAPAG